jgi:hypothetical protein
MSSKRHTCNCYDCVDGRTARKEWQHGGMDWETDEEELIPYRKPAGGGWAGKRKRPCKKSKTKEPCDFSVKKVYRIHRWNGEERIDYVMTCSRCGKHGQYIWNW